MLHESDLAEHGVAGEGIVWIEHLVLRSAGTVHPDDYANTFFSCRFCNNSRGDHYPRVDEHGRTLLDPTQTAWAKHFDQDNDAITPKPGDDDAMYTWIAYKLDHPKKIERRQWRRERIRLLRSMLEKIPIHIQQLHESAIKALEKENVQLARAKLRDAQEWQRNLVASVKELRRYSAIPEDAPSTCRCKKDDLFQLPAWLIVQIVEVDVPNLNGSVR